RSAFDLLRLSNITVSSLIPIIPEISSYSMRIRGRMDIEGAYAPYVVQQETARRVFEKDESLHLPSDLDYQAIHGLSFEEKAMLSATRPESVGQARRIEGMTPSGALRLLAYVKGESRKLTREKMVSQMEEDRKIGGLYQNTAMIEPETFLDLEVPTDIKISPSGKRIVYSTSLALGAKKAKAENAVSTIWLAETGKERSARQLTSGQFDDTAPQWSVDGGSIAFISDRAKAGKSSAIYVLSLEGGEPYPVTNADNEKDIAGFRWSPDGKSIAFTSPDEKTAERKARDEEKDDVVVYGEDWQYNRLRLLHVSTKTVTTLVRKGAHVASFAWSEDSKSLVYSLWKTPDLNAPGYHGVEVEKVSVVDKSVK
ncbi:hypothetical protein LTR28_012828, partial [Elasticomyces elasticus]